MTNPRRKTSKTYYVWINRITKKLIISTAIMGLAEVKPEDRFDLEQDDRGFILKKAKAGVITVRKENTNSHRGVITDFNTYLSVAAATRDVKDEHLDAWVEDGNIHFTAKELPESVKIGQKKPQKPKKSVLSLAIDTFGKQKQVVKAVEELAELSQALCRDIVGQGDKGNIAEEIADVEIMLEQLKTIYRNTEEVADWKNFKIKRLSDRIQEFE